MSYLDQFAQYAAERGWWWSVWPNPRLGTVRLMASEQSRDARRGPPDAWVGLDVEDAAQLAIESVTEGPKLPRMDG